jgi:4-amino-4-deoxy-L-arabinose transferase-like glycosyltransferase
VPSLHARRLGTLSVLIVALFYLFTIREGHDWGDDFSQYIQHAANLANGASYTETRYLYNPANPSIGPRQYPPGFPVTLAPVVRTFGLDLQAMKVEVILFFVAALFLIDRLVQPLMPSAAGAAVVLAVGLNPYFWDFKDQVLSELPFLFFFLATLLCLTRVDEGDASQRQVWAFAVLGGAAMYAAYATRVVGVVLLPSLVMRDLIRHRLVTKQSLVATGVFVLLAGWQYVVWPRDTSYTDLLAVNLPIIAANLASYLRWLAAIWENGYADLPRRLLFVATAGLAVLGYASLWMRPKAMLLAVAPLFYLAVIVVWPLAQDTRFLIPVIPIYLACVVLGALSIDSVIARRWGRSHVLLGGLLAVVAVTYIARYSTLPFGHLPEGIGKPESVELFDFVKASTRGDDVFVFSRPRALSLFGERTVTPPSRSVDPCGFWRYIQRVGATYLVTGPGMANEEATYLAHFVHDFAPNLREVMRNADVVVYHVESAPAACVDQTQATR